MFIFVTAHEEFALRAFGASAVDYLLKPFDRARLQKAVLRARETIAHRRDPQGVEQVAQLLARLKARARPLERLTIKSQGRVVFVETGGIDWIRGADNYSELHVGKSIHLLRQTLTSLERDLPQQQFIRISRSLIVNLDSVQEFRSSSHGDFRVSCATAPASPPAATIAHGCANCSSNHTRRGWCSSAPRSSSDHPAAGQYR